MSLSYFFLPLIAGAAFYVGFGRGGVTADRMSQPQKPSDTDG